jgi:hypothetical protein
VVQKKKKQNGSSLINMSDKNRTKRKYNQCIAEETDAGKQDPSLKRQCNEVDNDTIDIANTQQPTETNQSDFIVKAWQKLQELQQLMDDCDSSTGSEDEYEEEEAEEIVGHSVEALGFAVCARETLTFLHRHGLDDGEEVMQKLRERLVGRNCE